MACTLAIADQSLTMKILCSLLVVALFSVGGVVFASSADSISMTNPKQTNVFVFKADKKFLGSRVEVFSSSGRLITYQELQKRKMAIDFSHVQSDIYTIVISNSTARRAFRFNRK